jgi:hypothetical protein
VNFAGRPEWIGRLLRVRVTGANPNSLRGQVIDGTVDGQGTRARRA